MSHESKVAVSVDVEDWYHVPAVTGSSFAAYDSVDSFFEAWDDRYDYLTAPTHRTLDLLDDLGVRATFFVVADVVERYPGLVETIADRGHEIGCHGLHHDNAVDSDTKAPRFSETDYERRIDEAKRILEDASGQEVTGFRAPGAYVGGWTLDVLDDLGFEYDSSVAVNSLYNKTDSALGGVDTAPYSPARGTLVPGGANSDREFTEYPWPYYDVAGVKLPTGGGPMLRLFGHRLVERGLRQSLRRGHTGLYFHPLDVARESFPSVGNNRRRPGYWAFKGERTERRIRKLLDAFDGGRLSTFGEMARTERRTVAP